MDACNIKLPEFKEVIGYASRNRIALDKILSLVNQDSWISKKTIEMNLRGNLRRHLGKDYSALVLAIETVWGEETTDFSGPTIQIFRHAEINKGNDKDTAENTNALAVNI